MIALVAVVMASSCMTSSAVYAAVKAKKHMDEKEKDARDARKRARQERAEAGERASKDANEAAEAERAERAERKEAEAEADRQRKEAEAEADRKRKEAERIEKESSEWATMLNNFMVARTLGIGDLTELVNSGFTGVPRELVPRVLEKLKKRTSSELQYCKGKYLTNKEENGFLKLSNEDEGRNLNLVDPWGFRLSLKAHEKVDAGINISKEMWDVIFTGTDPMLAEAIRGENEPAPPSAFEITKCYEEKTKGMPDYFDSNNCERNKHLEYLGNCGGQDYYYCPCKASEAYIVSLFDETKS